MILRAGDRVKCINGYHAGWEGMIGEVIADTVNDRASDDDEEDFEDKEPITVYDDKDFNVDDDDDDEFIWVPIDFKKRSATEEGHNLSGMLKRPTGYWFHSPFSKYFIKINKAAEQFEFSF